ncbi:uncharacterized protein LOC129597811 [Paramacrobiotus metropolitanus]|uniref:uncharacterized protein LOC129597811 n=1 Tax=Paramacrobiotus metropolitanus TaxID=2943436 RepID=UPI00244600AF|nr:uncharacterized protein LOC129597811 [Paramacrobiotus metropolitanus]
MDDDLDEQITDTSDIAENMEVLLRLAEDQPERWYPCKVLSLQSQTGWVYPEWDGRPTGNGWQLATVTSNAFDNSLVVNDGPFWQRRRLRQRVPRNAATAETVQKVTVNLSPASIEALRHCNNSEFRYRWMNHTGTVLMGIQNDVAVVLCRRDMLESVWSEGCEDIPQELLAYALAIDKTAMERDVYVSSAADVCADYTSNFEDITEDILMELCSYFDIYERQIIKKVSVFWHSVLSWQSLDKQLIVRASSCINNSYDLALAIHKTATRATRCIYLIGNYHRCVVALTRILQHKSIFLNHLIIADNEYVAPDDFVDCYRTYVLRPEVRDTCGVIILHRCQILIERCMLLHDGKTGTLPCGYVCTLFNCQTDELRLQSRNADPLQWTLDFFEKLDTLCPPNEADREALDKRMEVVDILGFVSDGHFDLLAQCLQKLHVEPPERNLNWLKAVQRGRPLWPYPNLGYHAVCGWLQVIQFAE